MVVAMLGLLGTLTRAQTALAGGAVDGVVNVNTATAQELQLLPGIGPAKAELILTYRRSHPFRTVEELVRVKGIGRKMLARLRPHLTVSAATSATAAAGASAAKATGGAASTCACPPSGAASARSSGSAN